jgi:hypothetical protein
MSDDGRNIYFGFLNDQTIDVFSYEKGSKGSIVGTNEYPLGEIAGKINTFLVLPSGEAILSLEGGTLLKKSGNDADVSYQFDSKVIVDRFWFAGNQFYCRDAVAVTFMFPPYQRWNQPLLSMVIRSSRIKMGYNLGSWIRSR